MSDKKLLNRIDNIESVDERSRAILSAVTDDGRHEQRELIKTEAQRLLGPYFDQLAEVFDLVEDEQVRAKARTEFDGLVRSYSSLLAERIVREKRMDAYSRSQSASAHASAANSQAKSDDMDFVLQLANEICSQKKGSAVWARSDLAKEIKRKWDLENPPARSERTIRGYLDEVDFADESLRIRKSRKSAEATQSQKKNAWRTFSKSDPPR